MNFPMCEDVSPFNIELLMSSMTNTDALIRDYRAKCEAIEQYQQDLKSVNELTTQVRTLYKVELKRSNELSAEREQLMSELREVQEKYEVLQNEQINREILHRQLMAELETRLDTTESKVHNDYISLCKSFVAQANILHRNSLQTIPLKRRCLQIREYLKSVGQAVIWDPNVSEGKKNTRSALSAKSTVSIGTMTEAEYFERKFVCHKGTMCLPVTANRSTSTDTMFSTVDTETMTDLDMSINDEIPGLDFLPSIDTEEVEIVPDMHAICTLPISCSDKISIKAPTYRSQGTITRIQNVRNEVNYIDREKYLKEDTSNILHYIKKEDISSPFASMSNLFLPSFAVQSGGQAHYANINPQLLQLWQMLGETIFTIVGRGNIFERDPENCELNERNQALQNTIMSKLMDFKQSTIDNFCRSVKKRKSDLDLENVISDDDVSCSKQKACNNPLNQEKIDITNPSIDPTVNETLHERNTKSLFAGETSDPDYTIPTDLSEAAPETLDKQISGKSNELQTTEERGQQLFFGYQPKSIRKNNNLVKMTVTKRKILRKHSQNTTLPDMVSEQLIENKSRTSALNANTNSSTFQMDSTLDKAIKTAKVKQQLRLNEINNAIKTRDIETLSGESSDERVESRVISTTLDPVRESDRHRKIKKKSKNTSRPEAKCSDKEKSSGQNVTPILKSLPIICDFDEPIQNTKVIKDTNQPPNNLDKNKYLENTLSTASKNVSDEINKTSTDATKVPHKIFKRKDDQVISTEFLQKKVKALPSVNAKFVKNSKVTKKTNSINLFQEKSNKSIKTRISKRRICKENYMETLFGDFSDNEVFEEAGISEIVAPLLNIDSDQSSSELSDEEIIDNVIKRAITEAETQPKMTKSSLRSIFSSSEEDIPAVTYKCLTESKQEAMTTNKKRNKVVKVANSTDNLRNRKEDLTLPKMLETSKDDEIVDDKLVNSSEMFSLPSLSESSDEDAAIENRNSRQIEGVTEILQVVSSANNLIFEKVLTNDATDTQSSYKDKAAIELESSVHEVPETAEDSLTPATSEGPEPAVGSTESLKSSLNIEIPPLEDIDYSPASPLPENHLPLEIPKIIPLSAGEDKSTELSDISVELNATSDSILDNLIRHYSLQKHHKMLLSHETINSDSEMHLLQMLREIIEEYLVQTQCSIIERNRCAEKLLNLTNRTKYLSAAILEVIEDTDESINMDFTPPAPALPLSHQKCIILVNCLSRHIPMFEKFIYFEIERRLFNLSTSQLQLSAMLNYTHFYIALIDIGQPSDISKVLFFIYKCLYYFKNKSIPLIYTMLMAHPLVLPPAKSVEMIKDPLMHTIIALITNTPYTVTSKGDAEYKKTEMFTTLKTRYGYFANLSFSIEHATEYCIQCIQSNCLTNADYSLILIAKRMGCDWAIKNVIDPHLLPLLHQLITKEITISTENDERIANILFIIASIIKTYPVNENIDFYLNIFVSCLNASNRKVIQEAAVSAMCQLGRSGVTQIYKLLCNWRPTYDVSPHIIAMLNSFVHRRDMQFWFTK